MTTRPPDVTVVVAVYNTMPYLTDCLRSVLKQTVGTDRLELIAVNDGSTDGSAGELDRWAARYPGTVKVLHQANFGGPAGPSNRALDLATGRYVFFLGADDHLGPEALERLVRTADELDADIVLGRMVGANGRVVNQGVYQPGNRDDINLVNSALPWALSNTKLFRRSMIEEHHIRFPEELRSCSDQPFTMRAVVAARRIAVRADYDFYHAVRRNDSSNITYGTSLTRFVHDTAILMDAAADVITDPVARQRVLRRHFAWEVGKLLGARFLETTAAEQGHVLEGVRKIAETYLTDEIRAALPVERRVPLSMAQYGTLDDVVAVVQHHLQHGASPVVTEGDRSFVAFPGFRDPDRGFPDRWFDATSVLRRRPHQRGPVEFHWDRAADGGPVLSLRWHSALPEPSRPADTVPRVTAGTSAAAVAEVRSGSVCAHLAAADLVTGVRRLRRVRLRYVESLGGETFDHALTIDGPREPRRRLYRHGFTLYLISAVPDHLNRLTVSVLPLAPRPVAGRLWKGLIAPLGGRRKSPGRLKTAMRKTGMTAPDEGSVPPVRPVIGVAVEGEERDTVTMRQGLRTVEAPAAARAGGDRPDRRDATGDANAVTRRSAQRLGHVATRVRARASVRAACGLTDGTPLIVYGGRVAVDRSLVTAVDALLSLRGHRLAIVCRPDEPVVARLVAHAERSGVADRLHVVETKRPPGPAFFASADLAMAGFEWSDGAVQIPVVLADYIAAGLPMVVAASRPVRERLADLRQGELFVSGRAASLVAAVECLAGKGDDDPGEVIEEFRPVLPAAGEWTPLGAARIRLGLGTANFAGQLSALAAALSKARKDISVDLIMACSPTALPYPADHHIDISREGRLDVQLARVRRVLGSYTHLVVDGFRPVLGRLNGDHVGADLPALTRAGIKVALLGHGSEIRDPSSHLARHRLSAFLDAPEDLVRRLTEVVATNKATAERSGLPLFVTTPDLLSDLPTATWAPLIVDIDAWACERPVLQSPRPVVVHAPSRRWTKGTDRIIPVLTALHDRKVIDFRLVEGVPWNEMRDVVHEADIVVDQVMIGSYGTFGCEGMAAGKVVVAYLDEAAHQAVGVTPPVVNAAADAVGEAIEFLLDDRAAGAALAAEGLRYAREHHDGRRTARAFGSFLR